MVLPSPGRGLNKDLTPGGGEDLSTTQSDLWHQAIRERTVFVVEL